MGSELGKICTEELMQEVGGVGGRLWGLLDDLVLAVGTGLVCMGYWGQLKVIAIGIGIK